MRSLPSLQWYTLPVYLLRIEFKNKQPVLIILVFSALHIAQQFKTTEHHAHGSWLTTSIVYWDQFPLKLYLMLMLVFAFRLFVDVLQFYKNLLSTLAQRKLTAEMFQLSTTLNPLLTMLKAWTVVLQAYLNKNLKVIFVS